MDALDLLTNDHNRVRGLFARFQGAHARGDETTMQEAVASILRELDVHARIEEELFYPDARGRSEEVAEIVAEGIEEHHLAKVRMDELATTTPGTEAWVAKVTVLVEDVEHHCREEEHALFPKARAICEARDREALGARLDQRKQELRATAADAQIDLTTTGLLDLAGDHETPGRAVMSNEDLAGTVTPPG
jgi:hemerythrin superfamily protein